MSLVCVPASGGTSSVRFKPCGLEHLRLGRVASRSLCDRTSANLKPVSYFGSTQVTRSPATMPNAAARPARSSSTALANPVELTDLSE